jgi:HAD superfamily hydrolase (TIGR01509 family)
MFDTERLNLDGWIFAGQKLGWPITEEIVMQTLGLNIENTRRVFEKHLGSGFNFETARNVKVEYLYTSIDRNGMPVKPGLPELLQYLKVNRFRMTVATSSERSRAKYYLEKSAMTHYFDEIVCGDMITRGKPEPDIYLRACEVLGLAPVECLALEDSAAGILSAWQAGVKPVMIPDLCEPDAATSQLLYARLPSLFAVIEWIRVV